MCDNEVDEWGELLLVGGSETTTTIPTQIPLISNKISVGRVQSKGGSDYQVGLNLPYLSSTHFTISKDIVDVEGGDSSVFKYFLCGIGRNGTYVNSTLVPTNVAVEVFPGDRLSIKFKGEEKISYEFNLKEKNDFSKNAMEEEEEKNVNETSEINDSMVLIRMRSLEEENRLLIETNATHLKHIDAMAIDMSRLQNETVTQRGAITQLERDKSDLETHLLELSSNLSAVQANRIHLEDEMKHLRDKLAAHESTHNTGLPLAQKIKDLEHQLAVNLQLLESRQKLLSQGAEALEVEQQLTAKLKDKIKSLSEQLAATQASERTHKSVNDALQDVIAQGEETIERFQAEQEALVKQLAILSDAESRRSEDLRRGGEALQRAAALFERVYVDQSVAGLVSHMMEQAKGDSNGVVLSQGHSMGEARRSCTQTQNTQVTMTMTASSAVAAAQSEHLVVGVQCSPPFDSQRYAREERHKRGAESPGGSASNDEVSKRPRCNEDLGAGGDAEEHDSVSEFGGPERHLDERMTQDTAVVDELLGDLRAADGIDPSESQSQSQGLDHMTAWLRKESELAKENVNSQDSMLTDNSSG